MENKIWFNESAKDWNEALPIGNGRLGAMIAGNVNDETVYLNEDSVWYGGERNRQNPDSKRYISEIREDLMNGNIEKATKLAYMAMTSIPKYFGAYQPLAELKLWCNNKGEVTDYNRTLDLESGVVKVSYKIDGVGFKREYFVSAVSKAVIIKIWCEKPIIDMHLNIMRRPFDGDIKVLGGDTLCMSDTCGNGGVTYVTQVHGRSNGSFEQIGDFLGFTNASEVEIFVVANTDYHTKDPQAECAIQRENLEKKTYEELKDEHVKDYQKLYNRVNLTLSDKESPLPTNKRLENVKNGNKDRGLIELYFNFGRYMMISASRPNSMAMNLQGIWNNEYAPRWESNYTININTEMNYWPAEVCNLSECHEPMFDLIDKMFENGKRTAKEMYGCNGFMAHHCTDLWGDTAVEGVFFPSPCWPMGGAWMSLHLWESFLYSGDVEFLKNRAYPILKEAAVFFTEYMIKDKDGLYVTGPTLSPENTYILPNGDEGSLCMGAEMDNQIVRELFNSVINASEILDIDKDLSSTLKEMLSKIREPRINSYGGIMEWSEDYGELEPGHRHMSQMFALHPGSQINPLDTPSLAKACEGTLNHRLQNGGGHTGWSCAWIVNMYARLWKGEQAEEFFYKLLSESTLPNLFDCHPPFQIDGNFGGTAAIAEMLMQSHMHEINILPALPKSWESGSVIGLRARGGFTVSIWWEENKPKTVKITASKDGEIRVRIAEGFVADTEYSYENGCILFNCVAGNEYTLTK